MLFYKDLSPIFVLCSNFTRVRFLKKITFCVGENL